MTEELKRSKSVVTRLGESWTSSSADSHELVVAEVNRGISRMETPRRWTKKELQQRKLIFPSMNEREYLNAFRQLRTQLIQRKRSENFSVMVSSAGSGEKSSALNAINLAAAFALDPHKTALYIDCNPYRRTAENYLLEKPTYGVMDYLDQADIPLEKIIYPSGIDRLRIIPSGMASLAAAELFHSVRMEDLIRELKQRYKDRFIIVNAPSITASSEAPVLAQHCDMTVLIAPHGRVSPTDIDLSCQALDRRQLAGVVYSYL